jgi:hypothetical protein
LLRAIRPRGTSTFVTAVAASQHADGANQTARVAQAGGVRISSPARCLCRGATVAVGRPRTNGRLPTARIDILVDAIPGCCREGPQGVRQKRTLGGRACAAEPVGRAARWQAADPTGEQESDVQRMGRLVSGQTIQATLSGGETHLESLNALKFLHPAFGPLRLAEITPEAIEGYIEQRLCPGKEDSHEVRSCSPRKAAVRHGASGIQNFGTNIEPGGEEEATARPLPSRRISGSRRPADSKTALHDRQRKTPDRAVRAKLPKECGHRGDGPAAVQGANVHAEDAGGF